MALAQNRRCCYSTSPSPACPSRRRDVQKCLLAIPRDVTMVMIEHNMDVALEFAERITLLHFGEVIVEGNRAEVVDNPRTREGLSWPLVHSHSGISTPSIATATSCRTSRSSLARRACSPARPQRAPANRPA